jgi:hypothetical protein
MALTFEPTTGHDATLDREQLVNVLRFRVRDTLPKTVAGDYFDYISSAVNAYITQSYPTKQTPMGLLYWNSIQLHENFYAQNYDITVVYGPRNRASGTYQITVDQAVGNVHVTAGRRIAGYGEADNEVDNEGVIFDGKEVTGADIPVAEDRITVSYRHPQAWLNHAYIRAVGRLRGYPNSDAFLGYAAGEVVYMGGNFTETNTEASAQYTFAISPNVTNLEVGGITITEKKGWDLISPVYEPEAAANDAGKTHSLRVLKYIEIIRLREWTAYASVFGWGGT